MKSVRINGELSVLFNDKGEPVMLAQSNAYTSKRSGQAVASLDMWVLEAKALEAQVAAKDREIKARVAARAATVTPEVTDE